MPAETILLNNSPLVVSLYDPLLKQVMPLAGLTGSIKAIPALVHTGAHVVHLVLYNSGNKYLLATTLKELPARTIGNDPTITWAYSVNGSDPLANTYASSGTALPLGTIPPYSYRHVFIKIVKHSSGVPINFELSQLDIAYTESYILYHDKAIHFEFNETPTSDFHYMMNSAMHATTTVGVNSNVYGGASWSLGAEALPGTALTYPLFYGLGFVHFIGTPQALVLDIDGGCGSDTYSSGMSLHMKLSSSLTSHNQTVATFYKTVGITHVPKIEVSIGENRKIAITIGGNLFVTEDSFDAIESFHVLGLSYGSSIGSPWFTVDGVNMPLVKMGTDTTPSSLNFIELGSTVEAKYLKADIDDVLICPGYATTPMEHVAIAKALLQ